MLRKVWFVRAGLLLLLLIAVRPVSVSAQTPRSTLTIEEVLNLVGNGFAEELVITRIRKHGKAFDLNAEELVEIRKGGVSENIIKFLLDPSQPYTPPAPPAAPVTAAPPAPAKPSPPAKQYPDDAFAKRVPPDPGLYHFRGDEPVKADMKILLGAKHGAGVGKVLFKKGRTLAYLAGPRSKLAIQTNAPIFYLRLAEGKAIEDYVVVSLDGKLDRRELDMGPGPKQELSADAIRPYDSIEVGLALFRVTPAPLKPGEYLFFQIGSAEPEKGSQGRGFDFSISTPPDHR
jgi:hypothetical protein